MLRQPTKKQIYKKEKLKNPKKQTKTKKTQQSTYNPQKKGKIYNNNDDK